MGSFVDVPPGIPMPASAIVDAPGGAVGTGGDGSAGSVHSASGKPLHFISKLTYVIGILQTVKVMHISITANFLFVSAS